MAVSKTDLKFYLTTAEAGTVQSDPSQSIGGYVSTTPFNDSTTLLSVLSQSSSVISLSAVLSEQSLLVDHEIVTVSGTSLTGRGQNQTLAVPHAAGSTVFGLTHNSLFNDSFSDSGYQYRCIAVRNENPVSSFYNLNFYLKNASLNPNSTVSIGVEYAQQQIQTGTATNGGTLTLVDSSLADVYSDNFFVNCPITFTSGMNVNLTRVVASFDSATGTFVFTQSLSVGVVAGDTYRVGQLPSQRLVTGSASAPMGAVFSGFQSGNIPLNVDGNRPNLNTLEPFETVYIWFQRQINENADQYLNNRVVFTAHYTTA
jgi:hypothetical protein